MKLPDELVERAAKVIDDNTFEIAEGLTYDQIARAALEAALSGGGEVVDIIGPLWFSIADDPNYGDVRVDSGRYAVIPLDSKE